MIALFAALLLAAQMSVLPPLGERVVVLLFVRTDCPISNRYAPEIQRIERRFRGQGVTFRLVYPEGGVTNQAIERHCREYGYTISAIADSQHLYVNKAGARVTPEAALFVAGRLVYHGRIDNRYVSFGKSMPEPTARDLEDAIEAVLAGRSPRASRTEAVGCAIEPIR